MFGHQKDASIQRLAQEQAKYCRVFSNARRVQILWALADRELSVGAIAEAVGSSLQNVSQHLGKMKGYHIVSSRREGQTIYYRVERDALADQCLGLIRANLPGVPNEDSLGEKIKPKGVER
jgi:DNA-binding transcriptional ArsR family regulator